MLIQKPEHCLSTVPLPVQLSTIRWIVSGTSNLFDNAVKRKREEKYLDKHWKRMRNGLEAYLHTNDKEQMHALRVEVKKIRSMLILIANVTRKKRLLKLFKPVLRIFKHAGEIRNSQINLALAEEYQLDNSEFKSLQNEMLNEYERGFKQNVPKYLKKLRRTRRLIKSNIKSVRNESVAGFYKKQLKQIANSLAVPHFDDSLHDCRKQLKVLMYNYKLTNEALKDSVDFNNQYVDDLQNSIGSWHDHVLAIDLFASPQVNDKTVVANIEKQNQKSEQQITEISRDFLFKATSCLHNRNGKKSNTHQ